MAALSIATFYNRLVATAVDSAASREETLSTRAPQPSILSSILQAWHLLSLDAPTVAALWSWFFARAMRIDLPWYAPTILALGTWLIYVADRILDGLRFHPSAPLHRRHYFHARRRTAFLSVALAVSGVLIWLICARMSFSARHEDTVLFVIALLYLFLVHRPGRSSKSWLPKELAVGIVFASATAVPAWSRLETGRLALLPAVAIFAALCWLNCVAIERWESLTCKSDRAETPSPARMTSDSFVTAHPTTRWAGNHFHAVALSLAEIAAALVAVATQRHLYANSPNTTPIYAATLLAAIGFATIDRHRRRFSPMKLRIAADALLLTPLLLLPFLG